MRKSWITYCFLLIGCRIFALDQTIFNQANELYKNQQYKEAALLYEQLLKSTPTAAGLEYNTANAYFKSGDIAKSIVHYERAKRLHPDDEDIVHNLLFAQSKLTDKISAANAPLPLLVFHTIVSSFSAQSWSYGSIAFFWLGLACFLVYLFVTSWRKIGFYVGIVCVILGGFFFMLGKARFAFENKCGVGVIADEKVFVKSAPDSDASDLFVLHEGTEVKIQDKVDKYVKVILLDGKVGWVSKEQLLVI